MAAIDLPRLSRLLRLPDKNRCIGYQDKKTSDGSCINPVEKHGAERIIRYFLTDPLPEKQLHRVLMDIASTSLCGDHRKDQVTYIANRWETRIRKGYPELIEHDPDMRLDASPEGVAKDLQTTIRRVNGAIAALAELQEDMKDVDATLGDVQRALNGLKGNDQSIKNNVGLLEKTVSTMKDEFRRKLGQVQKNMEEKLRDELEALQENQFDVSDDDEEEDDDDDFESRPTTKLRQTEMATAQTLF
ncbi:hypothetical protein P152DRAFT_483574 [Eremomyces bilateralis CBS 781.70]|uniref:Uncharacterized protein n=1 Tax=Eremomyces bilateralis CBS 781.70 TaxID=1392243 RepID=A0A6G1FYR7_9PEZI|nr:uncharacterized protein P152DRAFT_483574 [Eremomyces bilateralis CBS 781.70]KAF1810862.1 hypothetical protein P152DRAFT_483574 [Eremomyces bilateralis CBS 781.70]